MAAKPSPSRKASGVRRGSVAKAKRRAATGKKAAAGRRAPAAKATRRPGRNTAAPEPSHVESQVEQIQRLIDVMVAAGAVEVELEEAGSKLRIRLKEEPPRVAVTTSESVALAPRALDPLAAPSATEPALPGAAAPDAVLDGEAFRSPMVGTFYRSASPDAEPFVKEGDTVTPDTVLCIIEAMKVMNEIKAETEGQIVAILAQNGEPVDYGQHLFTIKT